MMVGVHDQNRQPSRLRTVLHRVRVLLNPLLWMAGGAGPEHRAEFLAAVDLAARELAEQPAETRESGQPPAR
jgi:hypothetical protein